MRALIFGPEKEWLDSMEVATWLAISEDTFKKLVAAGEMPIGRKRGTKILRWHWLEIHYYAQVFGRGVIVEGEEPST